MTKLKTLSIALLSIGVSILPACAQTSALNPAPVTIEAEAPYLTMVNVFTPKTGTQDEVLAAVRKGLDEQVSYLPGFINATVHRSLDNDYVVVYAQWTDQTAVDAAVGQIEAGAAPDMMRAFTIANPEFHPYRVETVVLAKTGAK